jgi:hypothetical protein
MTGSGRPTATGDTGDAGVIEWSNCLAASTNHSRQTARRPGLLYRVRRGFAITIGLLSETWLELSV